MSKSRIKNAGGSGKPHSRQYNRSQLECEDIGSAPFETLGELEGYFNLDPIPCLICGREFQNVGQHITRSHDGVTLTDYRIRFNIPMKYGLCTKAYSAKLAAIRNAEYKVPAIRKQRLTYIKRANKALNNKGGTSKSTSTIKFKRDQPTERQMKQVNKVAKSRMEASLPKYKEVLAYAVDHDISIKKASEITGAAKQASISHHYYNGSNIDAEYTELFDKCTAMRIAREIKTSNHLISDLKDELRRDECLNKVIDDKIITFKCKIKDRQVNPTPKSKHLIETSRRGISKLKAIKKRRCKFIEDLKERISSAEDLLSKRMEA